MFQLDPPEDDGLYIPEVGPWSAAKHHFLRRYIDAFTTSMRDKSWSGLHYVDLFASAGIERIKGVGLDWGSPLIAAQAPHQFSRLHLCDKDSRCFEALQSRIGRFPQPSQPQLLQGDANVVVHEVVSEIPARSLTLAFLDPYGLHLNFDTIRRLSKRRVDLIIFFPDHLDALRNWEHVYAGQPDSNLTQVLGTPDWYGELKKSSKSHWAHVLRQIYEIQLATLGYQHFEYERIRRSDGRALYLLMFCCCDKMGGKIWRRVSKRKYDGQDTFDFQ
jgi:three-Cys-motif partner protein